MLLRRQFFAHATYIRTITIGNWKFWQNWKVLQIVS